MNRVLISSVLTAICTTLPSCSDNDDPQLALIDTTQVKITATVTDSPNSTWLNVTEEMTVSVSNIEMTAPEGVVLKSISLIANNGSARHIIDDKPFSGEPLDFNIPLTDMQGRINFSLRGNLIKKNSRDAEVIIADNIQRIVFGETPEFECDGWLHVSVKGESTTGEEYSHSFEVTSTDHLTIPVPQCELYWQPSSGNASTIEISLGGGATVWSPNTSFDCKITKTAVGHSTDAESTSKITIPNTPGSLNSENLQLHVVTSYFGTWENITIEPHNITNVFNIIETE